MRTSANFDRPKYNRRTLRNFGLAFLVATGAFWAVMLQAPPKTVAAMQEGMNIGQVSLTAAQDMPSFDDMYQNHMGVLDTLKR